MFIYNNILTALLIAEPAKKNSVVEKVSKNCFW